MSRPLVIANWKMQLDTAASVALARMLTTQTTACEFVCCPSFTALPAVADALRGSPVAIGAQDCAWEERASLTGEVSPADLRSLGCAYVLVGHSERRQTLGETDAMVAKKFRAAFAASLTPILCVGETEAEWTDGERTAVLERQLRAAFDGIAPSAVARSIAYEPVWAIGTGRAAALEEIAEAHEWIAAHVRDHAQLPPGAAARILYGGSVSGENIAEILRLPNVNGVLVGTASQDAATFAALLAALQAV